ncbi:MAG: phosphatase PAP2 family protein [Bacteroidales bacterium]|nr:phosphatase PAP2 family protein [Bacteroidales bacterium]
MKKQNYPKLLSLAAALIMSVPAFAEATPQPAEVPADSACAAVIDEAVAEAPVAMAEPEAAPAENVNVMDLYATRSAASSVLPVPELDLSADQPVNTHHNPYYNWQRDITYAGIPLFLSSFIIKDKKTAFRSARFSFEKNFKTKIDNYTQFVPYALIPALKLAGYEGRSSWLRLGASAFAANAIMALAVNATKYSVKEMRPDNSTRNSFPSGHTATAFVAATILHKEYGLTRSPWFSIGGYALATATGVMRVLNNRHWISDVMAGAGIGIMSTELGYFVADLVFKEKGVKNFEFEDKPSEKPSFFDIQMGIAAHPKDIDFVFPDGNNDRISLGTSTVFGVEGAYFLNKYLGVGGQARVTSTPSKSAIYSDEDFQEILQFNDLLDRIPDAQGRPLPGIYGFNIDDNNFTCASFNFGVYGNLPLSKRFSVGAKALCGVRLADGIHYTARNGNPLMDKEHAIVDIHGNAYPLYWFEDAEGNQFLSSEIIQPGVHRMYNVVLENPTDPYDLLKVSGSTSFNYVLGVNLTWRYKNNFAWKVFADFDSSKTKYTYETRLFSPEAISRFESSVLAKAEPEFIELAKTVLKGYASKQMNFFSFGASFSVMF